MEKKGGERGISQIRLGGENSSSLVSMGDLSQTIQV